MIKAPLKHDLLRTPQAKSFQENHYKPPDLTARMGKSRHEVAEGGFRGMIKHIVMFKLKEAAEGSDKAGNIQRLKAKLEALPGKIDEIEFFEVASTSATTVSPTIWFWTPSLRARRPFTATRRILSMSRWRTLSKRFARIEW